jgi:hypothetical protein
MFQTQFPPLPLAGWQTTRDIVHGYSKVLGRVRSMLTPRGKHWWHASLRATESGFTTGEIPAPERDRDQQDRGFFEVNLDLLQNRLMVTTTWGVWWEMPVSGQPPMIFCNQVQAALETMGIFVEFDRSDLEAVDTPYDATSASTYAQALARINAEMNRFKSELPGETSPVQLWPHHFDLALMWLSGRKVPGADPGNEEYADEQMSFGFSTGDEGIPEAYFYATAYPWPGGMSQKSLPPGAQWRLQGWKGALLLYQSLVQADQPEIRLLHFLRASYLAGSSFMI